MVRLRDDALYHSVIVLGGFLIVSLAVAVFQLSVGRVSEPVWSVCVTDSVCFDASDVVASAVWVGIIYRFDPDLIKWFIELADYDRSTDRNWESNDRGRITLPDLAFFTFSLAVFVALGPVFITQLQTSSLPQGPTLLLWLVPPLGALILFASVVVKARRGVR